jgi:outer membrane lipoprotein-sorting protein
MNSKHLKAALIGLFASLFIMGCEDNHAEEAGERIDEAVTDVQNGVEDACEEVKEGMNAEETNC